MNLLVIMSHKLLDEQKKEAESKLGVSKIKVLPDELLRVWKHIDPVGELSTEELNKIIQWINMESKPHDYVLIQGEFGSTFYLVDYCFKINRVPIYGTTNRIVEEEKVGNHIVTKRVFKHCCLRKYVGFTENII